MPLRWLKTHKKATKGGSPILASLLILLTFQTSAEPPSSGPESREPLAPGYGVLDFPAPKPGSYVLPDLGPADDAELFESTGKRTHLHSLMRDKLTVISFIYAACSEVNGCPLATSVLHRTQTALKGLPETLSHVRFLTVSFDSVHDTPEVMARYAQPLIQDGADWHFLTTQGTASLKQLLTAYQQSIHPERNEKGKATGVISHLLRVILVDSNFRIRNSYSPSVLHPDLLVSDIRTLVSNASGQAMKRSEVREELPPPRLGAGDNKTHYDHSSYTTDSASLSQRLGAPKDLIRLRTGASLGLPADPHDPESPLNSDKVALGRKLFFDRRLSRNGTFSCAMCHIPEQGFTSQEQSTAIGIEGRTVRRNAPTLLNVGRLTSLFHDGREDRLENQVWGPFLAPNEMGNPSIGQVIVKIRSADDYGGLFEKAFGKPPTMDTIGEALAQYERTLIAGNSSFDQWYFSGQKTALSLDAQKGFRLFTGKAGCSQCHTVEKKNTLFTDQDYHNTGVGYMASMGGEETKNTRVQLAPGLWTELDPATIRAVSEKRPSDLGRYEVTQNPEDRWKYRTPSLRNIALSAPYMHDGSLKTLEEVIRFYTRGGVVNPGLDPRIKPFHLTVSDVHYLVTFLESLSSSSVRPLVEDAWAAPIGDPVPTSQTRNP